MKRTIIFSLVATLLMAVSGTAQAQTRMALIDVGYIFKNHAGFAASRKSLEDEVTLANADFSTRRERLQTLQKELAGLQKNNPTYTDRESQLARESSDLNAALLLQRNKFAEKEAGIYYQVYQEIRDATAAYCKQNGITFAMQFNGEPLAVDNPSMVQAEVARKVIYYDQGMDITPAVLQMINARGGAAAAAPNGVRPR